MRSHSENDKDLRKIRSWHYREEAKVSLKLSSLKKKAIEFFTHHSNSRYEALAMNAFLDN